MWYLPYNERHGREYLSYYKNRHIILEGIEIILKNYRYNRDLSPFNRNNRNYGNKPRYDEHFDRMYLNNRGYGSQGSERLCNGSCNQRHGMWNGFGQSYNRQYRPNPSREAK